MAEYKDPSPLTGDEKENINKLAQAIRNKMYGLDVRESIALAIELTYDDLSKENNDAYAEVIRARGGWDTLRERLNNLSVEDINKNLGKIDQTYLSDELIEQIAGTAPINATPVDGSITTEKIANQAVTMNKLNIPNKPTSEVLIFDWGTPENNGSRTRVSSQWFTLPENSANVILLNSNLELVIYEERKNGDYISQTPWIKGPYKINNRGLKYKVSIKKVDSNAFTDSELNLLSSTVILQDSRVPATKGQLDNKVNKLTSNILNNKVNLYLEYKFGEPRYASLVRSRASSNFFTVDEVYKVTVNDPNLRVSVCEINDLETGGFTTITNWNTSATINVLEKPLSLYVKYEDDSIFTGEDLLELNDKINVSKPLFNPEPITKYVTISGSDRSSGDNETEGYATLSKALSETSLGTIYIEPGVYYHETVNASIEDITILPLVNKYEYDNPLNTKDLVIFKGSDELSNFTPYDNIYRTEYSGNNKFEDVFINRTVPIVNSTSRPTYNAVLWEGNDKINDYKMEPVLSLSECESKEGTFYYDGTYVYINPKDINNEFNAVKTNTGLNLDGKKLTIRDLVFDFYTVSPINLDNVDIVEANNCDASHSSTGDGWSLDYTNGTFTQCRGYKNRNDGFNMHFKGETVLIDCDASYNYDDGVSHHEVCKGTIIGGRFSHNGKGGIIPVNDAPVNVYNCVLEHNKYGFYADANNVISMGNLYAGNEEGIRANGTNMTSVNDVFVDNAKDTVGSVNVY